MKSESHITSFPELSSDRILLRKLNPKDKIKLSLLRSDQNVNEFIKREKTLSVEDAERAIEKINTGINNNEWMYWALEIKKNDSLAGTLCLFNFNQDKIIPSAEIGFELLPEFQGNGFIHEAVEIVIKYGFEKLNLNYITGFANKNNLKSLRVLEKCGFIRDKILEEKLIQEDSENTNMFLYKLNRII